MTSKDRRRYRHTIEPTHICGWNTYYMQWKVAYWHLTSNAVITTHNTYSNSHCAKTRWYGLTGTAWQGMLYMHERPFFSLPTTFTCRPEPIVNNLIKGIPKQVILYNEWFASTDQIHLWRGSILGYNAWCCEMNSKDRRRYHHTIPPTHNCGPNICYMQRKVAGGHLNSNAKITTHDTYLKSLCAKTRRHGVTVSAW